MAQTSDQHSAGRRSQAWRRVQSVFVGVGLLLLLGGFAVLAWQYRPYGVPTGSMRPTIQNGDRVLAHRLDGDAVRRGDVVVFEDPDWGNVPMVKRVVGVGGDRVSCCDARGRLHVNGQPVNEHYLGAHPMGEDAQRQTAASRRFRVRVPHDRLFLLGDKRAMSMDSLAHLDTKHGTVAESMVRGRVEATVWPVSRFGGIEDGNRAFHGVQDRSSAATSSDSPPSHQAGPGPLRPAVLACLVGAAVLLLVPLVAAVVTRGRRPGAGR